MHGGSNSLQKWVKQCREDKHVTECATVAAATVAAAAAAAAPSPSTSPLLPAFGDGVVMASGMKRASVAPTAIQQDR